MTKLTKVIEESIARVVPVTEEKEAIKEAMKLEDTFGRSKSINILDKYEKLIEGLLK